MLWSASFGWLIQPHCNIVAAPWRKHGALAEELDMATQTTPSTSEAYRQRMFVLLGDRDPLTVMSETVSKLSDIVDRHSPAVLRSRPYEGKWTPNEIIGHLTDSEWVYGYRLRLILCEDGPTILGTKQDSWVAALRYNEREPSELVEIFRALREFNLAVWRRTSPADLERAGQHNERG